MQKWMVAAKKEDFGAIAAECGISQILCRIIRNRDIIGTEQTRRYLNGRLSDLPDPEELYGIPQGADLLSEKIASGKKIRVIGDYDVDGICASAILVLGLRALGAETDYRLPDRIKDGYGLNIRLIREAADDKVDTILTCDNGIAATDAVSEARSQGMSVVVTDHHEVPYREENGQKIPVFPQAQVVVDPKRPDHPYSFDGICGAVVALKLIVCMLNRKGFPSRDRLIRELLGFAAIATVCDIMPLADENRIIVREGLKEAEKTENEGLACLISAAGLSGRRLTAYHAGFIIGPCLNASGRLDSAERALALFADPAGYAEKMQSARELIELNESRKSMTTAGVEKASVLLEQQRADGKELPKIIVIYLPECHESIAGIIAGKIREKYSRPAVVLTDAGEAGVIKGSGRSIEAYDLYEGLHSCEDLLLKYGGHKMAAGLTLNRDDLDPFRIRLNENCTLAGEDFKEILHLDMVLPPEYATEELVSEMELLEPCGNGNQRPLFACRDLRVRDMRILGKNRNVVKFTMEDEYGRAYPVLSFSLPGSLEADLDRTLGRGTFAALERNGGTAEDIFCDLCYAPQINEYRDQRSVQLVMKDVRWKRNV